MSRLIAGNIPLATLAQLVALTAKASFVQETLGRLTIGDGGGGEWYFDSSDLSTEVTADTNSIHYAAPTSDATGASGAWVRQGSGSLKGVSLDNGDANATLVFGTSYEVQLFATTLTANRNVTLPSTGIINGSKFRVVRTGLGAFTLTVGALKIIPNSTAAFVDVEYNGTAWILTGYGAL